MHMGSARRPPSKRSVSTTVRKPNRPRSRTAPTVKETPADREIPSPITDRQRVSTHELTVLAAGLRRVVAQVVRHARIKRINRFRAAFADAQQLVRKHPLQATLVGVSLGIFYRER